jgi:hypothetical protein
MGVKRQARERKKTSMSAKKDRQVGARNTDKEE